MSHYYCQMKKLDWKNENGEHFENHANDVLLPVYPWLLHDFREILQVSLPQTRILEIGCGPGFMLEQFSRVSPSGLTGLDRCYQMLTRSLASGRSGEAALVQGDACNLPFASATFDAVFSRGSVFFWSDLPCAFASIKNCLKPGGQALIGGGYGLNTPQEIIDAVVLTQAGRDKSGIPRLDTSSLAEIACGIGGTARILQAKKRGFWLHWQV